MIHFLTGYLFWHPIQLDSQQKKEDHHQADCRTPYQQVGNRKPLAVLTNFLSLSRKILIAYWLVQGEIFERLLAESARKPAVVPELGFGLLSFCNQLSTDRYCNGNH